MKPLNDQLRKTYGVSKKEANGMLWLVLLIIVFLVITIAINYLPRGSNIQISVTEQNKLDSLLETMDGNSTPNILPSPDSCHISTPINPNSCTAAELTCLGLPEYLSQRIIKYRKSGGLFRRKQDLKKIYGLSNQQYETIKNHLIIPIKNKTPKPKDQNSEYATKQTVRIDINEADTSILKKINGIGDVLSERIIKFRNRLGGFHSIEQLSKVYGLKGRPLRYLQKHAYVHPNFGVAQLNINEITVSALRSHPFISSDVATNIVNYRDTHGPFHSIEQLLELGLISQVDYDEVAPYLSTCSNCE